MNRIHFTILRSPRAFLYQTMGAMVIGIIAGFILTMLGFGRLNAALDTYFLTPVKTMYINALKMIVAPVVFFSIASCIVQFSNLKELGRIGGRVILLYITTTIIAVVVGLMVFYVFKPGSAMSVGVDAGSAEAIASQTMDVSIKDTIVSIVPSNFIQPFVESNMLQLIFLAVISGITAGLIGEYSDMVKSLFETFNELFLKITTLIIKFMPLAVFCSICSMILNMGISTILSVLGMLGTFLVGLLCMIVVYCLIIAIAGRINPLHFLKRYASSMLQVFSMGSSNAAIPVNMQACEKMGVDKKVYCLSLPLGATLNMDGTCVYMAVFTLALARVYGIQITESSLAAMVISIIVLSMGAPGIPGSGLICLSMLLTQVGVPVEAVGLVMGIDSFVGMFRSMSNCTGDVAISILVARLEKMLDMDKYNNVRVR